MMNSQESPHGPTGCFYVKVCVLRSWRNSPTVQCEQINCTADDLFTKYELELEPHLLKRAVLLAVFSQTVAAASAI